MRIALLVIISVVCLGSLGTISTRAQIPGHLVINEIEMDPPGPDFGKQWIELYNPANSVADVSGWRLRTASGSVVTVQAKTTVQAEDYLVLPLPRTTLVKNGDSIVLGDSKNAIIDTTPKLRDVSDSNLTWQRYPNSLDTGSLGDWKFMAATMGQSNGKFASQITLVPSARSASYGDPITIYGRANLTMKTDVLLVITSAASMANTTLTTMEDGSFTYIWRPNVVGTYSVTASWNGDALHGPASSSTITILVDKRATKLSMYPVSRNVTDMGSVIFTGSIEPAIPMAPVVVTVQAPNGTMQSQTLNTFANGSFRFMFTPSGSGSWTLTASWAGDANYYGDESAKSTLVVTPAIRPSSLPLLIFELITVPVTLAIGVYIYKYARFPIRTPLGQIHKRRAPTHLRPLRVLNGAICPLCFRPMMYEPKGADWHCEHCGVYYES